MTQLALRPRISAYPLAALSLCLIIVLTSGFVVLLSEIFRVRNSQYLSAVLRIGNSDQQQLFLDRAYIVNPWIAAIARSLGRLGVPTKRDINKLSKSVVELSAVVHKLAEEKARPGQNA